jgi:hypothetical protein
MIPAHLLDLVRPISFHSPVKVELDGGGEGVSTFFAVSNQRRTEALFSDAHCSRRTTPVTKATSGRGSSWDEPDSETEVEVVGTIHRSDAPWFNVAELHVLRSEAMENSLDNLEDLKHSTLAYFLFLPLEVAELDSPPASDGHVIEAHPSSP